MRVDLLTFLQKSTLENAVKESFKQLSLSKVDFSTPYVDADSTLIKSVAYFIDKKDQASVATGKLNFRNIWSNKTIAAPTVDLSVGLFAEARIVTASLSDRMIEKKNKSITSLNTLELHVYT